MEHTKKKMITFGKLIGVLYFIKIVFTLLCLLIGSWRNGPFSMETILIVLCFDLFVAVICYRFNNILVNIAALDFFLFYSIAFLAYSAGVSYDDPLLNQSLYYFRRGPFNRLLFNDAVVYLLILVSCFFFSLLIGSMVFKYREIDYWNPEIRERVKSLTQENLKIYTSITFLVISLLWVLSFSYVFHFADRYYAGVGVSSSTKIILYLSSFSLGALHVLMIEIALRFPMFKKGEKKILTLSVIVFGCAFYVLLGSKGSLFKLAWFFLFVIYAARGYICFKIRDVIKYGSIVAICASILFFIALPFRYKSSILESDNPTEKVVQVISSAFHESPFKRIFSRMNNFDRYLNVYRNPNPRDPHEVLSIGNGFKEIVNQLVPGKPFPYALSYARWYGYLYYDNTYLQTLGGYGTIPYGYGINIALTGSHYGAFVLIIIKGIFTCLLFSLLHMTSLRLRPYIIFVFFSWFYTGLNGFGWDSNIAAQVFIAYNIFFSFLVYRFFCLKNRRKTSFSLYKKRENSLAQ